MDSDIDIVGYAAAAAGGPATTLVRQIDEIFFEASSVKSFADERARSAFRWRWLGRYLREEPEHAFLALAGPADRRVVAGYLVGSLDDPATGPEADNLSYIRDFAAQSARYPAHLHINVRADMRGHRVGARLIAAFQAHVAEAGVSGVHIVTGEGMRNVGFYRREGFREVARARHRDGFVVMLAREVTEPGVDIRPTAGR